MTTTRISNPYYLSLILIFIFCFGFSESAVYIGRLKTQSQWHYWTKFCLSNQYNSTGGLNLTIHNNYNPNGENTTLQVMLYVGWDNREPGNGAWDLAYGSRDRKTCEELVAMHRGGTAGIYNVVSGQTYSFNPYQHSRAYFWYVAVADCKSLSGIDITYHAHWYNPGGFWLEQYSYDQQGVYPMYITFTIFYFILLIVHLWGVWQMTKDDSWHPVCK